MLFIVLFFVACSTHAYIHVYTHVYIILSPLIALTTVTFAVAYSCLLRFPFLIGVGINVSAPLARVCAVKGKTHSCKCIHIHRDGGGQH